VRAKVYGERLDALALESVIKDVAARAKQVGLIVLTTHGHGGINRFWLGSVADRPLRWVKVPILLLRPKGGPLQTEFRRILVALDGLNEGERILGPAIALGSLCPDCYLTLAQVVEPPIALITRMALQPAKMPPPDLDRCSNGNVEPTFHGHFTMASQEEH
jgi:nucleotide-binding universal stress UspA family protein